MTGVSECSQQRSNLKDDGYTLRIMPKAPITGNPNGMFCTYQVG
ncbi:hypothetical protein [Photorhabdus kayaii]|nr:hypothetical protein [Photorhabdus kayaii]